VNRIKYAGLFRIFDAGFKDIFTLRKMESRQICGESCRSAAISFVLGEGSQLRFCLPEKMDFEFKKK